MHLFKGIIFIPAFFFSIAEASTGNLGQRALTQRDIYCDLVTGSVDDCISYVCDKDF
jgi:hypothetical protein